MTEIRLQYTFSEASCHAALQDSCTHLPLQRPGPALLWRRSCCVARWLPQQIYSGASTHAAGRPQATQGSTSLAVGRFKGCRFCQHAGTQPPHRHHPQPQARRRVLHVTENGGRRKRTMVRFWRLTSGLRCRSLIQTRRVWLEKILYMMRRWGRHEADCHSARVEEVGGGL